MVVAPVVCMVASPLQGIFAMGCDGNCGHMNGGECHVRNCSEAWNGLLFFVGISMLKSMGGVNEGLSENLTSSGSNLFI